MNILDALKELRFSPDSWLEVHDLLKALQAAEEAEVSIETLQTILRDSRLRITDAHMMRCVVNTDFTAAGKALADITRARIHDPYAKASGEFLESIFPSRADERAEDQGSDSDSGTD